MKYGVHDHMGARVELEELALKALSYHMAEGYTVEDLNEEVHSCLLHCILGPSMKGWLKSPHKERAPMPIAVKDLDASPDQECWQFPGH
jgi:hypothetical protein